MIDNDVSHVITGFNMQVEHVNILVPQFERDYRSDSHKIDFSRRAVTEYTEWSQITIQGIKNHGYSFVKFFISFNESSHQLRQIRLVAVESSNLHTNTQYWRNPRPFRRHQKPKRHKKCYPALPAA